MLLSSLKPHSSVRKSSETSEMSYDVQMKSKKGKEKKVHGEGREYSESSSKHIEGGREFE